MGRVLVKECLNEKEREIGRTENSREREEYFWRNSYRLARIVENLRQQKLDIIKVLTERDKELQDQVRYREIWNAKYNSRYKYIRTVKKAEYAEKEGKEGANCEDKMRITCRREIVTGWKSKKANVFCVV